MNAMSSLRKLSISVAAASTLSLGLAGPAARASEGDPATSERARFIQAEIGRGKDYAEAWNAARSLYPAPITTGGETFRAEIGRGKDRAEAWNAEDALHSAPPAGDQAELIRSEIAKGKDRAEAWNAARPSRAPGLAVGFR